MLLLLSTLVRAWVASIVQLCVCLYEVTHRKRHNRFKSKKLEEREVGGLHCSTVCLSVCLPA